MATLTYRTAGESHGRALIALIEGVPAGVAIDKAFIDGELRRRQGGYGRGGRQKIETDAVEILSGVRRGKAIGSPIALQIINRDSRLDDAPAVHRPRPGHADLAGSLKWLTTDCRETLERASARETAARVAAGALARCVLREFGIEVFGYVVSIGNVAASVRFREDITRRQSSDMAPIDQLQGRPIGRVLTKMSKVTREQIVEALDLQKRQGGVLGEILVRLGYVSEHDINVALDAQRGIDVRGAASALDALVAKRDESDVYCPDAEASEGMRQLIRQAKIDGDTLGGLVEARVYGCPPGLGSCVQYDQKLDARLAMAVMGIQAFKAVEIGMGKDVAFVPGSKVHDEIGFDPAQKDRPSLGFVRKTNNAGGLEGGMTNGQPVVVRGTMKPIATLLKPLESVDLNTKQPDKAAYERSDVCAVPAASVVMENVVAFEIARALVEKFGGDSLVEMRANYDNYLATARRLPL